MNRVPQTLGIAMATLAGLFLGEEQSADEYVRHGNRAMLRGEPEEALRYYQLAVAGTRDPGLVAYNQGVVCSRSGDETGAEYAYRCALEDAHGWRKLESRYGLACILLTSARRDGDKAAAEAIELLGQCLGSPQLTPQREADVRHNLELARLRIKAESADATPTPSRPPPTRPGKLSTKGEGDSTKRTGPGNAEDIGKPGKPANTVSGSDATETDETPAPGKGNLPLVPDSDEVTRFSRAEANAVLEQAAARIRQERLNDRKTVNRGGDTRWKDW